MKPTHGILFLSVFLTPPLVAQLPTTTCGENETLGDCYARLQAAPEKATTVAALRAGTEKAANDRVTTASTPGVPTSVTDLLPSFIAAAGVAGLKETDESYTFDKVFELSKAWRLDLGTVIYRGPEIFEALQSKLPDAIKEQVLTELNEQIEDFDKTDIKLLLTWEESTGSFRFGRDPDDYWDVVGGWYEDRYEALLGASRPDTPLEVWEDSEEVNAAEALLDGLTPRDRTPTQLRAAPGFTDEAVGRLVAGLVKAATGMGDLREATQTDLAALAKGVSELITNQPQVLLEGIYRERDHLTGPSEWSVRFSYEWALSGNINDFLSWAEKQVASAAATPCSAADAPSYSYDCYQAWRQSHAAAGMTEKTATDRGNRLAIEAQYTETDPLRFEVQGDGTVDPAFTFSLDRTQKWSASLTYGINLQGVQLPNLLGALGGASVVPVDTARFDLEAKYEDVTGDPMRQSRLTATASVSQKMSNKTVLSLSVLWAEKPEYLGEVDEKVSANIGLKWKLGGKEETAAGSPVSSDGS